MKKKNNKIKILLLIVLVLKNDIFKLFCPTILEV